MTLTTAILYSLVRSLLIASLAIRPSELLFRRTRDARSATAVRFWMLAGIAPLFVPELLLGFTWRLAAAGLSGDQLAIESLYAVLQLFRCVSVLFAARLILADSTVTREALYSWRLLKPASMTCRWAAIWLRLQLEGPGRAVVAGWSVAALMCFQEFETAALLQLDRAPVAWSVWLFDAHAARQPLSDSMSMVIRPIVIEFLLLVPCLVVLWGSLNGQCGIDRSDRTDALSSRDAAKKSLFWSYLWLGLSLGCCVFWPLISNLMPVLSQIGSITGQASLIRQSVEQILVSLGFSTAAAVITLRFAAWSQSGRYTLLSVCLLLPGLGGSLFTGILLLAIFQSPLLHFLYDTWLPLLSGLCLSVLPRAWLIVSLLNRTWDSEAIHAAELLQKSTLSEMRQRSRQVVWRMRDSRWLLAGLVTCHWCFWDVAVTSILRPVQLEPIVTRLYNEMHYGRTEALVLIAMMAAAAPPICALTAAWIRRTVFTRKA